LTILEGVWIKIAFSIRYLPQSQKLGIGGLENSDSGIVLQIFHLQYKV